MVGNDDLPSRAGTPRPAGDEPQPSIATDNSIKDVNTSSEKQPDRPLEGHDMPVASSELPKDVQAKLIRLGKIESRYQGMQHVHMSR